MTTPPYDHPIYKAGDVIVEAMPLIYSLNSVGSYCSGCFKSVRGTSAALIPQINLRKCAKCLQFHYCSRECQRFDWINFHKHECPLYAKHGRNIQQESTRVALRLLILMQKRSEELTKLHPVLGGGTRCFMDLMDHKKELDKDSDRTLSFELLVLSLRELGLDFDLEQFQLVFYKFSINSFSILDIALNSIGTGLYIETSIFDHSCAPNAGTIYHGLKMQVRALKDISTREAIFVGYQDIIQPRRARQAVLLKSHCFTCQCVRCSSDRSDDDLVEQLIFLAEKIDRLTDFSITNYGNAPWKQIAKLYELSLSLAEQIYGQYNPGLTTRYINCLKTKMNAQTSTKEDFNRATKALEVTHGVDHPAYKQLIELREMSQLESKFENLRGKRTKRT